MLFEITDIGRSGKKPDQLVNDGFQMQLLGGHQWEAFLQIKTHLITEDRARARASAVSLDGAMFVHMAHEIEVLAHELTPGKPLL